MSLRIKGNRKYPTIPPVTHDLANHTDAVMAIKEAMEVGQRRTNNLRYSFITVQDLLDLGFIEIKENMNAIVGAPPRSPVYTVDTLPAGSAGDRAQVTDALTPVFGAAVVAGGAAIVPVYHTGVAWFVG